MKALLFISAASLFLLTACEKEEINIPEKNVRDILVTNGWRLTEQIIKTGTFDPFEEVPPEDVTVISEGCGFTTVIDFLDDGTYKYYNADANCFFESTENSGWFLEGDTVLVFWAPDLQSTSHIEQISGLQLLLSRISIGIESGEQSVTLYRYESL